MNDIFFGRGQPQESIDRAWEAHEARLGLLARLGPDGVLLLDGQGIIRYANDRCGEILARRPRELAGTAFYDLMDDQDRGLLPDDPRGLVDWTLADQTPWEIRLRRGDGLWQMISGAARLLNEGEILLVLRPVGRAGSATVSRSVLLAAVEAADSSIVIADAQQEDTPLVYVNRGFRGLTGYEEEEILGRNCRFLQRRPDGSRDPDQPDLGQVSRALREGRFVNTVLRNYRKDGRLFYNDLFITPVHQNGRLVAFIGVQNDITERLAAQARLQERERLLSSLFDAAPVLMGVLEYRVDQPDQPVRQRALNANAAAFFGLTTTDEGVDRALEELGLDEPVVGQWRSALADSQARGGHVRFNCAVARGREWRHLRVSVNPIQTEPGSPPLFCYLAEDITDLERVEAQRLLLEAAVENADESIVITEADLGRPGPQVVYVNQAFLTMTGYQREEVLGQSPRLLQGPLTDPAVLRRLRSALASEGSFRGETINYRKDGTPFVLEWNITALRDDAGQISHWVASQRDVTRRRRLEQEVLEVQQREQRRIAQDLHDSVVQQLQSLVNYAATVQLKLESQGLNDDGLLGRIIDLARRGAEQARSISHSLHPVEVARSGLMTALQRLASETGQYHGVHCTFAFEQPVLVDDHERTTHLYLIAREAVANAVRHGRARHILVGLSGGDGEVVLTVRDDGQGIPEAVLRDGGGGLGLHTMQYRAGQVGGRLEISRGEESGTVISCTFPGETSVDRKVG